MLWLEEIYQSCHTRYMFQTMCTAIAVGLHYMFLTVFFLMLGEAVALVQLVLWPLHRRNMYIVTIPVAFGMCTCI